MSPDLPQQAEHGGPTVRWTSDGPTILLASGHYFNLLAPERSVIHIMDVAHGLSNTCRFAGQSRRFYSVAEHSIFVAGLVEPDLRREALLHDAAEAFLGDVTKPLKSLLPDYRRIEARVDAAIRARFGLPDVQSPAIKQADLRALATEQAQLMPAHDDAWPCLHGIRPLPFILACRTPEIAEREFLIEWEALH